MNFNNPGLYFDKTFFYFPVKWPDDNVERQEKTEINFKQKFNQI